jgi:hypothetical protein
MSSWGNRRTTQTNADFSMYINKIIYAINDDFGAFRRFPLSCFRRAFRAFGRTELTIWK